jgi:hypothetical protein
LIFSHGTMNHMKMYMVSICLILHAISCKQVSSDEARYLLDLQKAAIYQYVAEFSCTDDGSCLTMPLGAKPCGGPWEYLVYPSTVNAEELQHMVDEYFEAESAYNVKYGIISDCSIESPPDSIFCNDGACAW